MHIISGDRLSAASFRPKHGLDGVACGWHHLLPGVHAVWAALLEDLPTALLWSRAVALLVPPLAGVGGHLAAPAAGPGATGCSGRRIALGLLMSAIGVVGWSVDEIMLGRTHVVAGVARGLRALRRRRAAAGPAGAAASRPARKCHGDHRRRHRRHRRPDRLSLFAFRRRRRPVVDPVRASHVGSLLLLSELQQFLVVHRHGRRRAAGPPDPGWKPDLPAARDGPLVGFVTLTLEQSRNLAGVLPSGRVARRDVDPAVRLLPVGGSRGAQRRRSRRSTPTTPSSALAAVGDLRRPRPRCRSSTTGSGRRPGADLGGVSGSVDGRGDRVGAAAADGAAGCRARASSTRWASRSGSRREAAADGGGGRGSQRADRRSSRATGASTRQPGVLPGGRLRAGADRPGQPHACLAEESRRTVRRDSAGGSAKTGLWRGTSSCGSDERHDVPGGVRDRAAPGCRRAGGPLRADRARHLRGVAPARTSSSTASGCRRSGSSCPAWRTS